MNCGSCKWWAKDKGECRANFPFSTGWPKTEATDWCRGYEASPVTREQQEGLRCPYCNEPIPAECGGRCASCNAKLD